MCRWNVTGLSFCYTTPSLTPINLCSMIVFLLLLVASTSTVNVASAKNACTTQRWHWRRTPMTSLGHWVAAICYLTYAIATIDVVLILHSCLGSFLGCLCLCPLLVPVPPLHFWHYSQWRHCHGPIMQLSLLQTVFLLIVVLLIVALLLLSPLPLPIHPQSRDNSSVGLPCLHLTIKSLKVISTTATTIAVILSSLLGTPSLVAFFAYVAYWLHSILHVSTPINIVVNVNNVV